MSYIVVYQREDGSSGVEECANLELAVVTAERLRNVDSVERPRILKTEEVSYDFKPYYRVEVTSGPTSSAAGASLSPKPEPATPTLPPAPRAGTVAPSSSPAQSSSPASTSSTEAPAGNTAGESVAPESGVTDPVSNDPWATDHVVGDATTVTNTAVVDTAVVDAAVSNTAAAESPSTAVDEDAVGDTSSEQSSSRGGGLFDVKGRGTRSNADHDDENVSKFPGSGQDTPPRRGLFGR